MAYAGALFADACLRGLNGEANVEEYSYVESNKTELPYFSTKVKLGTKGTAAKGAHKQACYRTAVLLICNMVFGPIWAPSWIDHLLGSGLCTLTID